jgi:hypothetical protein
MPFGTGGTDEIIGFQGDGSVSNTFAIQGPGTNNMQIKIDEVGSPAWLITGNGDGGFLVSGGDFSVQANTITLISTTVEMTSAGSATLRATGVTADFTIESALQDVILNAPQGLVQINDSDPGVTGSAVMETVTGTGYLEINRRLVLSQVLAIDLDDNAIIQFGDSSGPNNLELRSDTVGSAGTVSLHAGAGSRGLLLEATSTTRGAIWFGGGTTEGIKGDSSGGTLQLNATNSIELSRETQLADNIKLALGSSQDAEIYWDASDLVLDPTVVDSAASVKVVGNVPLDLPGTTVVVTDTAYVDFGSGSLVSQLITRGRGGITQHIVENSTGDQISLSVSAIAASYTTNGTIGLNFTSSGDISFTPVTGGGDILFNDGSIADADIRMESDNDANMFMLDGSADGIGIGTASPGVAGLDNAKATAISGSVNHTLGAGDNDDVAPTGMATATVVRLSGNATTSVVTGFAGGAAGRVVIFMNVASNDIEISNEDAGSSAANRILHGQAANVVVEQDESVSLWYDSTSSRWRMY